MPYKRVQVNEESMIVPQERNPVGVRYGYDRGDIEVAGYLPVVVVMEDGSGMDARKSLEYAALVPRYWPATAEEFRRFAEEAERMRADW